MPAEYPNHIWTYDFIFDQTSRGTPLKILTLTDEFTRRSLAIRCGTAFTSIDVKAVLKAAFNTNGVPMILRSDNGPEFIAHDLGEWLAEQGGDQEAQRSRKTLAERHRRELPFQAA